MIVRCPSCKGLLAFEGEEVPDICPKCGAKRPATVSLDAVDTPNDHDTGPLPATATANMAASPVKGRRFGDYEIVEEIGRGAMGIVYKAIQPQLKRTIALKVLLAGEHASEDQVGRFMREAQAIAQVRHPNIVPVYDVGLADGKHFFTMAFVEGKGLDEIVGRGEMTPAEALDVIEKVADAVSEAHAAGVIHRDIKPSNIMIDTRGEVRIMDFGLAKQMDAETQYTRSGTTIGTPAYMPPEQARGEIDIIDERSDVYAIGAVAYELFTGSAPFEGANMLAIIMDVLNTEAVPPRRLNPKIHVDIQTIILKCLEKNPALRYESAAELRDDIRRYKSGEAIRARPISSFRKIGRAFVRRKVEVLSLVALGVVVGLSTLAVMAMSARVRELENSRATAAIPSEPTWREVLLDSDPGLSGNVNWNIRRSYIDFRHGKAVPVLAGIELRCAHLYYAHVEFEVTATTATEAASPSLSVGFIGTDGTPIFVSYGRGKMMLLGLEHVDASFARGGKGLGDLAPLAEQDAAPLRPGEAYKLSLREKDMVVQFSITGPGVDESLVYKNIHFSNWRLKNLRVALRSIPAEASFSDLKIRQLYRGELDALGAADDRFFRGDYNGAQSDYRAIAESAEPDDLVGAHHRLGLYNEVKTDYDLAIQNYDKVISIMLARTDEPSSSAHKLLLESRLRSIFCRAALSEFGPAARGLEEATARPGAIPSPWRWHIPALAQRFTAGGDLDGAMTAIRSAELPTGFSRLEVATRRLASALIAGGRPLDVLALESWYPGTYLAPEILLAARTLTASKDTQGAVSMLTAAQHVLTADNPDLRRTADGLVDLLASTGKAESLIEVHHLVGGARAAQAIENAAASAASRGDSRVCEALLQYASHSLKPTDGLKRAASRLADSYIASGTPSMVPAAQSAYPPADLSPQLLLAARSLDKQEKFLDCLKVLEFARDRTAGKHRDFAALAASAGARYVMVDADRRFWQVLAAFNAYPGPEHLENLRQLIDRLAEAGSFEDALSVYSFARSNLPESGLELDSQALTCLEDIYLPDRREAGLEALSSITANLEDRPAELAAWRVAYGDMYLRFGYYPQARELYEQASKAAKPARGSARGRLRLGILAEAEGSAAKAAATWLDLLEGEGIDDAFVAVARFMLGRADAAELTKAANASTTGCLEPGMIDLMLGLRIVGDDDAEQIQRREHLHVSRTLTAKSRRWPYHVFAARLLGPDE